LNTKDNFQLFYNNFPFLPIDKLIDYFSIFGGLDSYTTLNLHSNSLKENLKEFISNSNLNLPFFVVDDPFRKFLIQIARGDGKIDNALKRVNIGQSFGEEIIKELIDSGILYIVNSREKPIKIYAKQLIKKELRAYTIQNKLRFTKPVYKFWFGFVEPLKDRYGNIDFERLYQNLIKHQNRLTYIVFETLSRELLKEYLGQSKLDCSSYWDRFSEFDIYCVDNSIKIVGECKYTSRPVTKAELAKLEAKIEQSALQTTAVALFSKSGFSSELAKSKSEKLLLFELSDYRLLLNSLG
jgi:hypothetical protein